MEHKARPPARFSWLLTLPKSQEQKTKTKKKTIYTKVFTKPGWVAIVFFSGLLITLAVIIARDPTSSSIEYLLLLLPLWAVATAVQRLRSDLQTGQIIVRDQGVEFVGQDNTVLINWETVKLVRVKRFYDAGLLLLTEKGERAFISAA